MTFEKKIYELSLWDDGPDGEVRRCTIASNTMSSPARAFNINLNKKTNGEKTLTFSIYAKYFDQEICDYVTNPYLGFLTNERKVKLKKEEKGQVVWYDMIIKQVSEDSSNFTYTYTAKDQHIQELAKSGFELEFDKELQNNTGTKEELAREILKGTGWEVEDGERLLEYTKEPVYRGLVEGDSTIFRLVDSQETLSIDLKGKYVYVTYYFVKEKGTDIQILYNENDSDSTPRYSVTDEGILDRKSYRIFKPEDANVEYSKIFVNNPVLCPGIRGERLVNSWKTVYDKVLKQYVKVYKDGEREIYGFTRTEYNTPELVENLVTNGEGDFISTDGWYNTTTADRELSFNPSIQDWKDSENIESFIRVTRIENAADDCFIVNTGLFDNRTKIPGFTAGQTYIFDCQLRDSSQTISKVLVREYDYSEGRYFPKGEVLFEGSNGKLTCNFTISAEQFKKKKYGIFIYLDSGAEIKSCQFYRDVKNSAGESILPGQVSALKTEELVKTHYYYYNPDDAYTKFEDIKFLYEGYEEQTRKYSLVYNEDFEKRRSITGKESNRFNLLQEICEQFECWLKIEVNHDSMGKILPSGKKISFHEYVGKDNYAGFKYGINLKSIKRQIDSNQIVTKMITKDNSNEFAKNGFCSIARAPSNPSGTNVIYNFDYYIGQNLLGAEEVSEALYLTPQGKSEYPQFPESLIESDWENLKDITFPGNWGLYPKIDDITTKTQTITEEQIGISKNLTSLKASIDYEQARLDGAESSLVELEEDLEKLTGYTYEYFLQNPNPKKYEKPESGELTEVQEEYNRFVDWALSDKVKEYKVKIRHLRKEVREAKSKLQSQVAVQQVVGSPYYWGVIYDKDKKELQLGGSNGKKYITAFQSLSEGIKEIVGLSGFDWYIATYFGGTNTYKVSNTGSSPFVTVPEGRTLIVISDEATLPQLFEYSEENGPLQNSYQIFKNEYDLNNRKLEYYSAQRKKIEEDFYKRYSRFIQEGSWISENYIDDELYYLDALATGYTSSRPKVTYTIDVFDLAGVEDYENYEFEIGDKTFVQDQEFFGWIQEEIDDPIIPGKKITVKRPYREEVVVNELTEGIDDITKNTLKVQNYKTQFDDLFQRIAATTESLQYNTGRYERGAKVVEPDGSISHKALQQAVTENGLAIANAGAQTVTIDEQGVVTTDKTLPNKKVRIIGGGIYVTKDGGETWETGITGDGINANVITTGQLNTGEINIMTGDVASHRWDDKGITAYRTNYNPETGEILSISPNSFVRLDEFGLYGINSDQEFNARIGTTTTRDEKHGIEKIQRDSLFSLTQDGLTIGKEGYGLKATEESITIGPSDGFKVTPSSLEIASWTVNKDRLIYGDISTNDCLFLAPAGQTKTDISGYSNGAPYTIYSKGNFGITTEGKLHAQDAWIGGHIEADTGNIGGIEIAPNGIFSKRMLANQEYSSTSLSASFDETTNTLTLFDASEGEGKLVKAYQASEQESMFLLNCRAPYHWYIVDIFRVAGDYSVFKHGNASTVQVPVDKHLIIVVDSIDESVLQVRLSSKFSLDSDGYLYAQNADISGTINANNGTIGGIIIKDGGLTSEQNTSQLEEPEKRRHSSQKNSSTSIKISNYNASNARAVRYYKLTGQNAEVKVTLNKHGQNINLVAVVDDIPTGNADNFSCNYAQVLWTGSVLLSVKKDQYILISSDIDDSDSNWGAYEIFTAGFSISSDGSIIANKVSITGVLQAGAGSMFGNFITTESALCFGSNDPSKAKMFISSTGESATIANKPLTNWTIGVGNNFGITSDGNVYATKVYLTGGSSRDEEVYLDYEGVHLTVISTGYTVVVPWGSMG